MSHALCPYVQRAVISLLEKDVPFQRTDIDLANKPDWFTAISPLGKTPVLVVDQTAVFESAVILEYLEDTQPNPLHPSDPLARARDRAWIEFGSSVLGDIAGFYNARDADRFAAKTRDLAAKFERLENELAGGPFFNGEGFGLVDAAFGPVFRYFDVFDRIGDSGVFDGKPKVSGWRNALAGRRSVAGAVAPDYDQLLLEFLERRASYLSGLINPSPPAGAATGEGADATVCG
jgi:glutathione S-transferase